MTLSPTVTPAPTATPAPTPTPTPAPTAPAPDRLRAGNRRQRNRGVHLREAGTTTLVGETYEYRDAILSCTDTSNDPRVSGPVRTARRATPGRRHCGRARNAGGAWRDDRLVSAARGDLLLQVGSAAGSPTRRDGSRGGGRLGDGGQGPARRGRRPGGGHRHDRADAARGDDRRARAGRGWIHLRRRLARSARADPILVDYDMWQRHRLRPRAVGSGRARATPRSLGRHADRLVLDEDGDVILFWFEGTGGYRGSRPGMRAVLPTAEAAGPWPRGDHLPASSHRRQRRSRARREQGNDQAALVDCSARCDAASRAPAHQRLATPVPTVRSSARTTSRPRLPSPTPSTATPTPAGAGPAASVAGTHRPS